MRRSERQTHKLSSYFPSNYFSGNNNTNKTKAILNYLVMHFWYWAYRSIATTTIKKPTNQTMATNINISTHNENVVKRKNDHKIKLQLKPKNCAWKDVYVNVFHLFEVMSCRCQPLNVLYAASIFLNFHHCMLRYAFCARKSFFFLLVRIPVIHCFLPPILSFSLLHPIHYIY